ncbi:MAG: ATP-binding protein [Gammaproteobacteria bacterium]|nr:ATP-binding protein [Gammaproteobacteria bacterium]
MNLFTRTLKDYLIDEWERALSSPDSDKKAIFIVESLDPDNTMALFSALEAYRLKSLSQKSWRCHFKVAKNLWLEWCKYQSEDQLRHKMAAKDAVDGNGNLKWVDQDDRLTKWRNEPIPADIDGLVIVLLGFNHASDQGGLADFHRVDEHRVWSKLEQGFNPWIRHISEDLDLDCSEQQIESFDVVLHQLFKVRPRLLVKLAEFFERKIYTHKHDMASINDVLDQFYQSLAYWDIPPLLNVDISKKKSVNLIKEADAFISHQKFKSASDQKKAWQKLGKAFEDELLDIPEVLSTQPLYHGLDEYRDTLHDFIFKADAEAKAKLLQTDLLPVLNVLKLRTEPKPKKDKIQRLSGFSVDVLLQAVWQTVLEFESQSTGRLIADVLQSIEIEVKRFNHDLEANSLAEELIQGCLGGLADRLDEIDLRFPVDEDQSLQLRDQWQCRVPIVLNMEGLDYGTSRARPHVGFKINLITTEDFEKFKPRVFQWSFEPTHPERVQYYCAKWVLEQWKEAVFAKTHVLLPAFQMPEVIMTALYFAADEEEANRLVSLALCGMKLTNLVEKIDTAIIDSSLWVDVKELSGAYFNWLQFYIGQGYYAAMPENFIAVRRAYENLAKRVLDKHITGGEELLRCFYKAFLLIDDSVNPNDGFLKSAVVWGLSPPVLELSQARCRFLCDSFPEVVGEHLLSRNGKDAFDRLLNLVEIHRPLAGLVINDQRTLSAKIKSFGLLHYLGEEPATEKSLAVQTLLRDDEIDDDDNIADVVKPTEESSVVERVLSDYLALYPFAEDGLRILAVHVEELATILSGVDRFLRHYLKQSSDEWPPFHCEVMVYSTSSSPLSVETRLAAWRHQLMDKYREQGRSVIISVAHHFAPTPEKMVKRLKDERQQYDIGFLFRFLSSKLTGDAEMALPFEFDFHKNNFSQFPICEYPRPIQQGEHFKRKSLLSNRRLRIQTHHADLSARLRHPQNPDGEHLIFGHIDYQPWQGVVEAMHKMSQWVACIDPFVDKHLLTNSDNDGDRRIVGFTSGLGAYGELNLSISTEHDTLSQLTNMVKNHLVGLLPFQSGDNFESMAVCIVNEAEEVIGLSSLRAVVGKGEKIREVIGFAAIRRLLSVPENAGMTQLLPVDALQHWFAGSDVTYRPDLMQLSLILRDNEVPLIQAVLIECKFAKQNDSHLMKAYEQVQDGLSHLTQLLTPNRCDIRRVTFDRRYWWAQLQRSITSRYVISMPEQQREKLDVALEQLTEGYYEIHWQGAIFTFWTDDPSQETKITNLALPAGAILPPFKIPPNASIRHVAMGYKGLEMLFSGKEQGDLKIDLIANPITAVPEFTKSSMVNNEPTEALSTPDQKPGEAHQITIDETIHQQETEDELTKKDTEQMVLNTEERQKVIESEKAVEKSGDSLSIEPSYSQLPEKLLIGTKSNGEPVYWHYGHQQLANRHLIIFGSPGFGKTYGIQCLLAEMAFHNLHSLIIDYTNGFLPDQLEKQFNFITNPKNHYVYHEKLPLNPFKKQQQIIDPLMSAFEEKPFDVATRVSKIFKSVFDSMGEQQFATLVRTLESGVSTYSNYNFESVLKGLIEEQSSTGETLANKLEPFIKAEPFRQDCDSSWGEMLNSSDSLVNIIQLLGYSSDIQRLVTEFILWDLYDYARRTGNKNRPIPVVLDEIHNLDHSTDSPLDKMIREGRKFGLSLVLATQDIEKFSNEERSRLFMAGHKLFFKPADTEIKKFAELLFLKDQRVSKNEWSERLSKLQKGQCWSLGPVLSSTGVLREKAELVSVTSLEERDFGV